MNLLKYPQKISKTTNVSYGLCFTASVLRFIKQPGTMWWLPLFFICSYVLMIWLLKKNVWDKRENKEWSKKLAQEVFANLEYLEPRYYRPNDKYNEIVLKHIYTMCKPQPAQLDCRITDCPFHKDTKCTNAAPAITLNENGTFVCWTNIKQI